MKLQNIVLLGFVSSAVEYLNDQFNNDEVGQYLRSLNDNELEKLRTEMNARLESSIGVMNSTVETLMKTGSAAFRDFINDEKNSELLNGVIKEEKSEENEEFINIISKAAEEAGIFEENAGELLQEVKPNDVDSEEIDALFNEIVEHEDDGQQSANDAEMVDSLLKELQEQLTEKTAEFDDDAKAPELYVDALNALMDQNDAIEKYLQELSSLEQFVNDNEELLKEEETAQEEETDGLEEASDGLEADGNGEEPLAENAADELENILDEIEQAETSIEAEDAKAVAEEETETSEEPKATDKAEEPCEEEAVEETESLDDLLSEVSSVFDDIFDHEEIKTDIEEEALEKTAEEPVSEDEADESDSTAENEDKSVEEEIIEVLEAGAEYDASKENAQDRRFPEDTEEPAQEPSEVQEEEKVKEVEQEYVSDLIEELKQKLAKEEEEKQKIQTIDDIYESIAAMYPHLSRSFIRSVYDLKEPIALTYPLDKKVIILHRLLFTNLENLRSFVENVLANNYTVNVDERKMMVDTFKEHNNTDGKILSNIFEISNLAKGLGGDYEGYRVIVKEDE